MSVATNVATDREIVCEDCQREFVFSAVQQGFYAERGFQEPTRCPECRAQRRAERNADLLNQIAEERYGQSERGHGVYGGNAGGAMPRSGRGFSRGPRPGTQRLYPAVCAECGKETEVPFQPAPGRKVYCRECFRDRRRSHRLS